MRTILNRPCTLNEEMINRIIIEKCKKTKDINLARNAFSVSFFILLRISLMVAIILLCGIITLTCLMKDVSQGLAPFLLFCLANQVISLSLGLRQL